MSITEELEDQLCRQLDGPLASLAKVMPWPEEVEKLASPRGGAYCLVRFQVERVMGEAAASAQKRVLRQTIRFLFEVRVLIPSLAGRAKGYDLLAAIKGALNGFAPTLATEYYAVQLPGFYFLEQGLMPTKTQGIKEFAAIYAVDMNYSKRG